jgi:hypothetical protein
MQAISEQLFNINNNLDITYNIKERHWIKMIHRAPHADKHLQLSSFCDTLLCAKTILPWWNEVYTIEYLYYVGLVCTPVSPRFAMYQIFQKYSKYPPKTNLTQLLVEISNESQGGVNKASGHRYSPSCGKSMPEQMLYWSLKNLHSILQRSQTENDTFQLVTQMSKHPIKGGVYKMGMLSAYEILSIYSLTSKQGNVRHATNAVMSKNNHASKFLEQRYGFKVYQQTKLLTLAAKQIPHIPSHVVENVSCKMSYDDSNKKYSRCDTLFSDQKFFFKVMDEKVYCIMHTGKEKIFWKFTKT